MKDYDDDFFPDYTAYSTSFGIDLKIFKMQLFSTICNESLHFGYVMAQKRALVGEQF